MHKLMIMLFALMSQMLIRQGLINVNGGSMLILVVHGLIAANDKRQYHCVIHS